MLDGHNVCGYNVLMIQLTLKNCALNDYKFFVRLSNVFYDSWQDSAPRYVRFKRNKLATKPSYVVFLLNALRHKAGFNRFSKFYFSKIVRTSLKLLRNEEVNALSVEACTEQSKLNHVIKDAIRLDALRDNLAAGFIKITLSPKLSISPFARQAQ